MRHTLPFLAAAALVLLTGTIHGLWTGRWIVSYELRDSAALLRNVPMTIGDWKGENIEINPYELQMASIVGYVKRRYTNVNDNTIVSVLIVSGRPGPISVHTPDICFEGAGYQLLRTPARLGVPYDSGPKIADFFWGDFSKTGAAAPTNVRVFWSWYAGGVWRAPENPRLAHAMYRVIYKLYVLHETPGHPNKPAEDPSLPFTRVVLPAIARALSPAPAPERR
jgi:hypothetical protein